MSSRHRSRTSAHRRKAVARTCLGQLWTCGLLSERQRTLPSLNLLLAKVAWARARTGSMDGHISRAGVPPETNESGCHTPPS